MAKEKKEDVQESPQSHPGPPPRLHVRFKDDIDPKIGEQFGLKNPMSRPRLDKIVLNVNMGRHLEGNKIPANVKDTVIDTLTTVSGQKPVIVKAKRSVSNFKVREGADTAARVTLRRDRMWHFLDRLVNLTTPRIKDFRGLPDTSFDAGGNYSMGLSEQAVFPEIDMGRVSFTHGLNINIVFSNSNPDMSRFVLTELGMPFRRPEEN